MIKNIQLKSGRATGAAPLSIEMHPITVFVGPNNSGKSKALREIHDFCEHGSFNAGNVIVENIIFEEQSLEDAQSLISLCKLEPKENETIPLGRVLIGKRDARAQVPEDRLLEAIQTPNVGGNPHLFCSWYLRLQTLRLDGSNRINMVNQQKGGNLLADPENTLQVLFRDDEKREEVRRIIYDAFGKYFVIDPTSSGNFRVRFSDKKPKNAVEERGLDRNSIEFHKKALLIDSTSDGVRAFTGIIAETVAGDPKILLIDEPEAFLHPSLAFKLGKEVALAGAKSDKRIFISTHSPNFVMGCIQSGTPLNVVRLTYRNNVATARILPNKDILHLMRHPLLRSTGVLDALFYEHVIVTEGDADRAFYREINERLLQFKKDWGIPNCLFLNAQNWQTIAKIVQPLRELGIPAAGIYDVDIIKDRGSAWTSFMKSGFVPVAEHAALSRQKTSTSQKMIAVRGDIKQRGIKLLKGADYKGANRLFDQLDDHGLFVVRGGELESWLKRLKATGHGSNWLVNIFEKMGEAPRSPNYLKPARMDVWKFMFGIRKWFLNVNKKGIPS